MFDRVLSTPLTVSEVHISITTSNGADDGSIATVRGAFKTLSNI